ncbi:hypothetical protein PFICI_10797 [Pestalotiopsis fici W106-1]|uniref:Carboxypeptidase n=1 Tax=Pestalotiopsis fici (strain W106-1 / CGMCC3.15140) TaxID=1229662 RepID=W3WSS7_PESFW|nr:uncharacterized protein PFICI_10797 [Pestalotiopsis fici W106-1]ETS76923.1 hypothetical protein PFICI_10797 [Pestalotiopsis fici W106-1]
MVFSRLATISFLLAAWVGEVQAYFTQSPLYRLPGRAARVRSKPTDESICSGRTGFSGYVDTEDDRHMYFWGFPSENNPQVDPVILWLTGGPGASGVTFRLFDELGPCLYAENGTTIANEYSWHSNATMIFIDQPINVGYSYSGQQVSTLRDSTTDLLNFLVGFMDGFPEYAKQPFYIAGESYGGSYVPALASRIYDRQKISNHDQVKINLQGILIGNGLFNDVLQRRGFYELACVQEFGAPGKKFLNASDCDEMLVHSQRCEDLSILCKESDGDTVVCGASNSFCRKHIVGMIDRTGRSPYDIRQHCYEDDEGGELCMPPSTLHEWLNTTEVRRQLHVDDAASYIPLNYDLEQAFGNNGEIGYPSDFLLNNLLDKHQLRTLIYVGNRDWYCNAPGTRYLADSLAWHGQAAFRALPYAEMFLEPQHAESRSTWGFHKKHEQLSFFEIDDAGHLAPKDKPRETREMVFRWINGEL